MKLLTIDVWGEMFLTLKRIWEAHDADNYFMEHTATKLKPKKLRTKSLVKRLYGP